MNEIDSVLVNIEQSECDTIISKILSAKRIVWVGAGKVGMTLRAFIMRLGHLWLQAWFLWDSTLPWIKEWDLLLVASWSGETQTIFDLVEIAKKNGCDIGLITGNPESRMGKLANSIVKIQAPSKTKAIEWFTSIQPMTTLNEQCLRLFFDALTLELMDKMNETHNTMWARHSNLE